MTHTRKIASSVALAAGLSFAAFGAQAQDDVTVIELTQTGCQFVESEGGMDHGYTPTQKSDCEENAKRHCWGG